MLKRTAVIFISCILSFNIIFVPSFCEELNPPFELSCKSVYVIEMKTGEPIIEKNSNDKLPIASITKVMSTYLFMEALEMGKISLDDVVIASDHACSMGGSQIYLEPGEEFIVEDLLKAVCIHSANDATVALAEHVSGSEEAFVSMMNERAEQLNLKDTHFLDCSGLTDEGHYSTAHDIALLTKAMFDKHPNVTKYSTIWHDTIRNGDTYLDNRNQLINKYDGCNGLKTGYTDEAMYCITATAKRNDVMFNVVVLGCQTGDIRNKEVMKLFDYCFANFEVIEIEKKDKVIKEISVKKGTQSTTTVKYKDDMEILLKKGQKGKVEEELIINEEIEAPVKEGDKVGEAIYKIDNKEIGKIEIVIAKEIQRASIFKIFFKMIIEWFSLGRMK